MEELEQKLTEEPQEKKSSVLYPLIWTILLVGILMLGAYFRFVGLGWDDNHHLHPDERFMTMVTSSISSVKDLGEYFNTDQSSLNPNNRGYGFYVYGTLPLFTVRYAAELLQKTGYDEVHLVGRTISGIVDLLTVLLVFLIAQRLYKNPRLSLLAAAFAAVEVLPIQHAHFYTVDNFATMCVFLAIYFAVRIFTNDLPDQIFEDDQPLEMVEQEEPAEKDIDDIPLQPPFWLVKGWGTALPYGLFGLAAGWALASKVSVWPLVFLLPLAAIIQIFSVRKEFRNALASVVVRNLILGGIVCLLTFRIFQPFAFSGPGFFDLKLNEKWLAGLNELTQQSKGDVDIPPALQWARRPLTFAWTNMVEFGLGWPLGLLAWGGFIAMGWRMFKGEFRKHILLWSWTGVFFVYQSVNWVRAMRYQLPVYPALAIIAAWVVFELWNSRTGKKDDTFKNSFLESNWKKILAGTIGTVVLVGSVAWAFAFTRIYTRPVTRVEASQWIYENIPSAINLEIAAEDGNYQLPLPFQWGTQLVSGEPIILAFKPKVNGVLTQFNIAHALSTSQESSLKNINVRVAETSDFSIPISVGNLQGDFLATDDPRGIAYTINFSNALPLDPQKTYYLAVNLDQPETALNLAGVFSLGIMTPEGMVYQTLPDAANVLKPGKEPYRLSFEVLRPGTLREIYLPHAVDWEWQAGEKTFRLSLVDTNNPATPLAEGSLVDDFIPTTDGRGDEYRVLLSQAVSLEAHHSYQLVIEMTEGNGALAFYGYKAALESTWDDPIPMGLEGYNSPFDYTSGLYRTDLNFEMYWDDNEAKRDRFQSILDQTDYIFITSNRQWGTTVRVPERYPLTLLYYRSLMGCPDDKDVIWCYRVAQPGMFESTLGFELVSVFQSDPNIGPFKINTQFAEEAFTVYDHPKVLIFKKTAAYDAFKVASLLKSVDLTRAVHLTPHKAEEYPGDLMLTPEQLVTQREGGTWSELFDSAALINSQPWVGMVFWYITIMLLGWIFYPFTRLVFSGLADKAYPMTRMLGLLTISFITWWLGSCGIPVTRITIAGVTFAALLGNAFLAYLQREKLRQEWSEKKKYFLTVEIIILVMFLFFLLIRLGNPDLWHPYKGGEKPMDFSYFNAVIKSTTFPPYDPWFAGGYINYYYFGFVIAGMWVKLLGIMPAIAYNLVLCSWFSFMGIGVFCAGWNLVGVLVKPKEDPSSDINLPEQTAGEEGTIETPSLPVIKRKPFWSLIFSGNESQYAAGLVSAVGCLILGNLGTVRMIWEGFQKMVAPNASIDGANTIQHWMWAFQGMARFIAGQQLPYPPGDWYWIPSRALPGSPITEFPLFTFLYADPHAHLLALPVTVLALVWAFSLIQGRWHWGEEGVPAWVHAGLSFLAGGMIIGALRPTNTWDLPTYLVLGCIAVIYAIIKYAPEPLPNIDMLGPGLKKAILGVLVAGVLVGLSFLLYEPFARWYGAGYTSIALWEENEHAPLKSYNTHWGLFLFVILSWFVWETIDWMAKTPLSYLKRLRPYLGLIIGGVIVWITVVVLLTIERNVEIAWLALLVATWAAILLIRPGIPDGKRFVLFMIGTAMFLTLAVEIFVLVGDVGRMNTVFKFYLQAWTLLSISAGVALIWLWQPLNKSWQPVLRDLWTVILSLLVGGALLFTIFGGLDKVRDRINAQAPHTLNGMTYMASSHHNENGVDIDLSYDYRAIRWMQENVKGSPVIVEGNVPEYRWGSRYTIYTGLPGVVGWNWHQRQQRSVSSSDWVTKRVEDIGQFYRSVSRHDTLTFLQKYQVSYIIVGKLEAIYYPQEGLAKFSQWNGKLWDEVYRDGDTAIYRVREEGE